MLSIGVREFKDQINSVLRRVRTKGEIVEITYYGQAVARLVPVVNDAPSKQSIDAVLTDFDSLAAEIGQAWQGSPSALEAIEEVRRDL